MLGDPWKEQVLMDGLTPAFARLLTEDQPAALPAALTQPLPCLLCHKPAQFACLFFPTDQRRVRAPAGKVRMIRYSLCKRCRRRPDGIPQVEARLFGDLDALGQVN